MAGLEGGPVPTVATRSLLNIVVIVLVAAAPVLDPVVRLKRREVLPQDVGSGVGVKDLEAGRRFPRTCCGEGRGAAMETVGSEGATHTHGEARRAAYSTS